jgi:hypothetical protein
MTGENRSLTAGRGILRHPSYLERARPWRHKRAAIPLAGALVWATRNTCGAPLTPVAAELRALASATTLETTLSPRYVEQITLREG